MGNTSYNFSARATRAASEDYFNAPIDHTFKQQKKARIHDSMSPKGIIFREARDSDTHPNSVPIILALDVTGSMGRIPHNLIKTGLPKMMGHIIEKGTPDPALLFLAIGDHLNDTYPLQVGQFESGDAELDNWLTSTYLEGGGGGNGGESYLLAWYFAAFHTKTDADEKRHQKGFLFTVGDEPCHHSLAKDYIRDIMGNTAETGYTADELLKEVQKKWNVYHLNIMEGSSGMGSLAGWKTLLPEHCIQVDDSNTVADVIAKIVVGNTPARATSVTADPAKPSAPAPVDML